jgi:serine/threonine protein kinase
MRILADALDVSSAERVDFLSRVCDGDDALRRSIDSLLVHADADFSPQGDIACAARKALDVARTVDLTGRQLDGWTLRRRLGEGGMGAVYLAERNDEQGRTERAAIKVIRRRVADDGALRRFRAEQRILAQVRHPNIARLIEAGTTDDGLPYLALEYIDGEPIDEYCDRRRLTVRRRLELFRQVCLAVQQAHDRHIVHRDLKPANILVTADGTAHLLDFGIAKLLAPELIGCSIELTSEFLRLMTPAFASPEQVRGEAVTPASDVYSLGVMLYSLVCGRSPYDAAGGGSPERIVCDVVPSPPSRAVMDFARTAGPDGDEIDSPPEAVAAARGTTPAELATRLRSGVDRLVLAALAKHPGERYADALGMLEAIDACLGDGRAVAVIETMPERKEPQDYRPPAAAPVPVVRGKTHAGNVGDRIARPPDAPTAPQVPAEWGHLQIVERLGAGAFGEVLKCWDPALETNVALKLFRTRSRRGQRASAEVAERALREGRLLARVKHPHVVQVLRADAFDAQVGISMEYIEGKTLEEVLQQQGPMSNRELAGLGIDLCSALAAVHGKGVIHRDIKAQNVIRESGGRVVLTDFGTGLDLAARSHQGEGVAGTPLYMAPEVLNGGIATVQSDVYGLGVLLYRMATGRFPMLADSWAGLVGAHERGEMTLVRDARPDVKPELARIIEKALAPELRDRYATAGQMMQDLEKLVASPASWAPWLAAGFGAVSGLIGFLFVVGFLASLTYHASLHTPGNFIRGSFAEFLTVGFRTMIPGFVSIALAMLTIWIGLRLIRLFRGERWQVFPSAGSVGLARGTLLFGLAGIALNIFVHRNLWHAIIALSQEAERADADFSLLANYMRQYLNEWAFAAVAAVMIAGICATWYRSRDRDDAGARLFALQCGLGATALLACVLMTMPWKLLVNDHAMFSYVPVAGEVLGHPVDRSNPLRAVVIERADGQAWVYFPELLAGISVDDRLVSAPTGYASIFAFGAGTRLDE